MPDDFYTPSYAGVDAFGGGGMFTGVQNYGGGGYVAPTPAPTQGLLSTPDSSYAATRGWSSSPYAMGNTGPQLQGGNWGGLVSQAYNNPWGVYMDPGPSATGGAGLLGGADSNPTYGDLSGSQNFSTLPGGNYNDVDNVPYTNPYGDLSGVPVSSNPYGNLSGSQNVATGGAALGNTAATGGATMQSAGSGAFNNPWGIYMEPPAGVQQPGQAYGGLLGSPMPNPTIPQASNPANLPSPHANPASSGPQAQVPGDNYGFPADDQTYMDMPQGPNGQFGSLMGGQDYGEENPWAQSIGSSGNPNPGTVQINTPPAMPINTQPQSPGSPGVQMPGGSPYGALPATMGNTPTGHFQYGVYMDGPAPGAAAAPANPTGGAGLQPGPTPQQDAYLFPTQPLMSPTNVYGDGGYTMQQPGPMPAQQQFQQGMQPQAPSQYQPSFGSIPQFTPMPAAADALKSPDRVPQTGGFTGYSPPALPPVSQPTPYQPSMFEGLLGGGGGEELGWSQRRFGSN